jgi:hypothetical protein
MRLSIDASDTVDAAELVGLSDAERAGAMRAFVRVMPVGPLAEERLAMTVSSIGARD